MFEALNDPDDSDDRYFAYYKAIESLTVEEDKRLGREGYIDLLDAALSGKRVVNPKTDRERLEEIINRYPVPFITADSPKIYSITDRELAFLFRLAHEHVAGDPE